MKNLALLSVFFITASTTLFCQTNKLFYENKARGYILYVNNPDLFPISIQLNLELENLAFSEADRKVFVIPPKVQRFKIGELTASQNGRYKFNYKFKSTIGDITITDYDKSIAYDLPFQKGKSYHLYQGYRGSFSHQTENALDFTMPEGTEILAAREGVIVQVVQNNTEHCPSIECKKFNNYITIMHADGTYGNYGHIKFNGSVFKVGDLVKRGDVIAYSGNVGYTSGPHLHFVCFLPGFENWNTIETKFKIDKGNVSVFLQEKSNYRRDY